MAANSSVQHRLHFLNNFLRNSADGRVSPIRSQLCTDVLNLSSSSSRYYKRKAVQAVETVLEAIAPQQSTCLFNRVAERYSSGRDGNRPDNQLVGRLIKLYEEASSGYTRQKILSIFVCDHSKSELLTLIPGLTTKQENMLSLTGLVNKWNHHRSSEVDCTQQRLTTFLILFPFRLFCKMSCTVLKSWNFPMVTHWKFLMWWELW